MKGQLYVALGLLLVITAGVVYYVVNRTRNKTEGFYVSPPPTKTTSDKMIERLPMCLNAANEQQKQEHCSQMVRYLDDYIKTTPKSTPTPTPKSNQNSNQNSNKRSTKRR